jgi:hypothetical protein
VSKERKREGGEKKEKRKRGRGKRGRGRGEGRGRGRRGEEPGKRRTDSFHCLKASKVFSLITC